MIRLDYAPDLVEEAVLLAERAMSAADRRTFRSDRDRLYERPDDDGRDREFRSLHWQWFERLGLDRAIADALGERPELAGRLSDGRVLRAVTRSEDGADLVDLVGSGGTDVRPLLVLRLRPPMLLEPESVRLLLRHELIHVSDMLDPAFGYERSLPPSDDGPSSDNIARDRYRALWDVSIEGRLARAGLGSDRGRGSCSQEFLKAFAMLGDRAGDLFDDWFTRIRPTHAALAALAAAPNGTASVHAAGAGRCPLCRFPVASLDRQSERLSPEAEALIRRDQPAWRIEQGLCSQCLDLYEARHEEAVDLSRRSN